MYYLYVTTEVTINLCLMKNLTSKTYGEGEIKIPKISDGSA